MPPSKLIDRLHEYLNDLPDNELDLLVDATRNCPELDRCMLYCSEEHCDFHDFLLLLRTPARDLRTTVQTWLGAVDDDRLARTLAIPMSCDTQSFCVSYCAATCEFADLYKAVVTK